MANWNNPQLTSTYTNFVTEVKDRDTDVAKQFNNPSNNNLLGSNHATGTIRWDGANNKWLEYNGTSWVDLTSRFSIDTTTVMNCAPNDASGANNLSRNNGTLQNNLNADKLDSQEGSYYRNASNINTGTISDARLPSSISSDITGNAASATNSTTFTCTANNATNETVYPVFVDGTTGSQGAETDTGFTYNPNSGLLSTGGLSSSGVVSITNNTSATSTTTGALKVTGGISTQENLYIGGTLVESSARYLKANIKTLPKQLNNVLRLNPVSYSKKVSGNKEIGLIADEVQKIYPDLVNDKVEGINYSRISTILISSIKELKDLIDIQSNRIQELEAKLGV